MEQTLYCEVKFLVDFFTLRPRINIDNPFSEDSTVEIWGKYRDMLLKNAVVNLDVGPEKFSEIKSPFLDMLKKKKGDGEIKIEFNKYPVKFEETKYHTFFFYADELKSQQMENDYGFFCISNENYVERANFLFSTDTFRPIDEHTNWDVLKAFKHPCNSLIIIDNYILNKPDNVLTDNLKVILLALLPNELRKQKFSISLYTKKPVKSSTMTATEYESLKETITKRKNLVEKTIQTIEKPYTIELTINWTNSQHDRCLLTNYCIFDCGYGFVLEQKEKKKGTRLHINRITQPQVLQSLTTLKDRVSMKF